jgi:type VII secretion protein EssB
MEKLSCHIKNSELACPKEKREFLVYQAEGLCPCALVTLEDGIELFFDSADMEPARIIHNRPQSDKLRFLVNAADLERLHTDYVFSLAQDNLLVDLNLRPRVLQRDLNCDSSEFLPKYKALIGDVLTRKYSYDDYINGGADLYNKHKLLKELCKYESVDEIRTRLTEEYHAENLRVKQGKRLVSKHSVIFTRICIPILAAALLAASYFAAIAIFIEIPYKDSVIRASQSYIVGDYIEAQIALRDLEPEDMTHETRHFLSRAYVITEALTDDEIRHILVGLTPITDGALFDYWIFLGRLEFDYALEIARRYGDSELLLFAYLKQRAVVEADLLMPGDEKVALLNYLDREIARLLDERTLPDEEE